MGHGLKWNSAVCHNETVRVPVCLLTLALAAALGQAQSRPDWRRVGPSSVEAGLASPVTGPVDRVWFSPGDSVLYARTHSGKTFQTADYETWAEAPGVEPPAPPEQVAPARFPEPERADVRDSAPPQRRRRAMRIRGCRWRGLP